MKTQFDIKNNKGFTMLWICKYCGENEKPKCTKCTREDGKLVTDELVED